MKYRDFLRILTDSGFVLERQRGRHRIYKGIVGGKTRLVVVSHARDSDDIGPGVLSSMIRHEQKTVRIASPSGRQGQRELVAMTARGVIAEDSAQGMTQELQSQGQGSGTIEQVPALMLGQCTNGL